MREEFWGEWIHLYVWLSPFTILLKLSQHCLLIGYTPVQNKNLKIMLRMQTMKLEKSHVNSMKIAAQTMCQLYFIRKELEVIVY